MVWHGGISGSAPIKIAEKKLEVLGSPLPIDDKPIDWGSNDDFNFKYEIGLAPKFDVEITSKDKLNYYNILNCKLKLV